MLFNSLQFLLFFPAVCVVYFLLPRHAWRNAFLLVASYYFYMCWQPTYALLLLVSTLLTYAAARLINVTPPPQKGLSRNKVVVAACVAANLAILFFFKYFNFAADNISALMATAGVQMKVPQMKVLLPVGISFYIFQAIGYTVDVYRGTTRAERNVFTYALFVSFFPQLVAGPIERSTNLLRQLRVPHAFCGRMAVEGCTLMLWGYFMKLVLADRCALYVDAVFNNLPQHNGGSSLLAAVLFAFQIYGDFAGYTFIAIGAARVLGFTLTQNFRRPYLAVSVSDFWHRWHISLSTWLRDYVYIPLGGSRRGRRRTYLNLMLTFLVSGLWHGAAWTYVLWGALHGVALCAERATGLRTASAHKAAGAMRIALTFTLTTAAWIFFRANTTADALLCFRNIATDMAVPMLEKKCLFYVAIALAVLAVGDIAQERRTVNITDHNYLRVYSLVSAALLALILYIGVFNGGQFIYFQF